MGVAKSRRRILIITLAVCMLLLLLSLATLNAFNANFLNPVTPLQTLVFLALSAIVFLLFVGVLVLLVRNILKLYADQRSRVLGTRLRTRMLRGAVLVSLVPLVFMFAFSYLLMNRAVDRWFSQPVTQMRSDASNMVLELYHYANANARSEADAIAVELSAIPVAKGQKLTPASLANANLILQRHEMTLQGGFVIFYMDNRAIASLHVPNSQVGTAELRSLHPSELSSDDSTDQRTPSLPPSLHGPIQQTILQAAQRPDEPFYSFAGSDYTLGTAGLQHGGLVVVALPIPSSISATSLRLRKSANAYWALFRQRRRIRNLYTLYLLLITAVALFACCWLALYLSKQITRPVESLADAMEAIASGDYAHRVGQSATEELGELVESFNAMAADLENAHSLAEQSSAKLSDLNQTLQARRTELETIIETIPSGVVTLSIDRFILLANRAFSEMLDPGGQRRFVGFDLSSVLPADMLDTLDHLLRRAHRMGAASAEIQMQSSTGIRHLAATVAILEGAPAPDKDPPHRSTFDREHFGYVLVLEDATELLRAQKQSAWKEVARRVAHEIKNPLTPISLNADLIRRHIARLSSLLNERNLESPSPAIVRRSTDVILASVETMRALVDQFSALAEFPSARPLPADLNTIVDNALALFAGRLGTIRLRRALAPDLPLVLADPEALKRALSNLIDNAAEAMQDSLLRELQLSTRLLPSGMIELTVADTGPGLTDDMRERLFLPYFSTKQRGTGLGLSIAAKIIQEHHGSIRVERNLPAGARFILELRPASESAYATAPSLEIPSWVPEERS
ncbi:MAG: HAMP domain-containing protein [Acidobacteria bacterium]|nr:HAMP domain-containing protein [Acidobacteriota bacterium]